MGKRFINIFDWGVFIALTILCCDLFSVALISTAFYLVGLASVIENEWLSVILGLIVLGMYLSGLYVLYSIYHTNTRNIGIRNFITLLKSKNTTLLCVMIAVLIIAFILACIMRFFGWISLCISSIIILTMVSLWRVEKSKWMRSLTGAVNKSPIIKMCLLIIKKIFFIITIFYWFVILVFVLFLLKDAFVNWWCFIARINL